MLKLTTKQFEGELYVNHKNINFIRQSMEGLAVIHFMGGETLPTNVSYASVIEKLYRLD